jgi:hypothetical protein
VARHQRDDTAGPPESVCALADAARAAAERVLRAPSLYSVLVDLQDTSSGCRPVRLRFGYQEIRRRWVGGDTLRACWIDVGLEPRSVAVGPAGTFGRQQFDKLASIPGMDFPPPSLDLTALGLEPVDVLRAVEDRPVALGAGPGQVELSLFQYDGQLAWRVLQEVHPVGVRTLYLHAGDGRVLFEKVDRSSEP